MYIISGLVTVKMRRRTSGSRRRMVQLGCFEQIGSSVWLTSNTPLLLGWFYRPPANKRRTVQVAQNLTPIDRKFIGAFAKLRKATISFVMSVRPSVRHSACNNTASGGRIFIKLVFGNIWKICRANTSSFTLWYEKQGIYMNTNTRLW